MMGKGLTGILILGLCLGIALLGEIKSAQAVTYYGAYEQFLADMSPAIRAMAAFGQLQSFVNRGIGGIVTYTVSAYGLWTVYTGGKIGRAHV